MAKKFSTDQIRERVKTNGTASTAEILSAQVKGEDDRKDTVIRLRITEEEKARWNDKAKELYKHTSKPLSMFIRDVVNSYIDKGEE